MRRANKRGPESSLIYPLSFEPVFKDYIWGGRNLETKLGRKIPQGIVAESWEIAAHPHGQTRVAAGPWAGRTLGALQEHLGEQLVGSRNRQAVDMGRFPLLIKLLDANRWLSVQVHPDDLYAQAHAADLGKTEMWIILHAEPHAKFIYGLKSGVNRAQFEEALAIGSIEQMLHEISVKAGDVVFIPAGTVHALGPGLLVAEIQQNSDTTYRLYDWGRVGAEGKPRPLHIQAGVEVIDWQMVEPSLAQPRALSAAAGWEREELAHCPYFQTERLAGQAAAVWHDECSGENFQIWAALSGGASIHWAGPSMDLKSISWLLLPATLGKFEVRAETDCVLLRII